MKLLIVTLCVLAYLIPSALSIDCYVCRNSNGNCMSGKTSCSGIACLKAKGGDAVAKTCTNSLGCNVAKSICKNSGDCEAYCCDSDLCNGGVPLKPVKVVTLLAMALAVAKYLM
ncbi:CD59 glycoprotein-like isoform X1 [Actinia tenebrosa]|uniref:CD59 glycoprotein-like isoform X1 n=1 Tax=Actinia tenebrosa TaxID=6105 RepID=A0A6P8IS47_ACTTE|nr:CD59 glycoprotein-like isoform X1 [Actinia tenebrosa]